MTVWLISRKITDKWVFVLYILKFHYLNLLRNKIPPPKESCGMIQGCPGAKSRLLWRKQTLSGQKAEEQRWWPYPRSLGRSLGTDRDGNFHRTVLVDILCSTSYIPSLLRWSSEKKPH